MRGVDRGGTDRAEALPLDALTNHIPFKTAAQPSDANHSQPDLDRMSALPRKHATTTGEVNSHCRVSDALSRPSSPTLALSSSTSSVHRRAKSRSKAVSKLGNWTWLNADMMLGRFRFVLAAHFHGTGCSLRADGESSPNLFSETFQERLRNASFTSTMPLPSSQIALHSDF